MRSFLQRLIAICVSWHQGERIEGTFLAVFSVLSVVRVCRRAEEALEDNVRH